ncbi:hypothetical protein HYY74_04555 [Candidatus Woesearchaeota archaeon]|nr:hypothetical protein [Candidatus Woesearchaeota archaeon]
MSEQQDTKKGKEEQDVLDSFLEGHEIFSILNKIQTAPNSPIRIVLLTKNFEQTLDRAFSLLHDKGIHFEIEAGNDSQILWNISVDNEEGVEKIKCPRCNNSFKVEDSQFKYDLVYKLVEIKQSGLLILMTNSKDNFDKLINYFNLLYPIVSRIFYRAHDLRRLLNKIRENKNIEVVGRECVVKRLFDDKRTVVTYQEDTVDGFFEKAKKDNSWVDSIEVLISSLGILRFSRKGTILYNNPFNFSGFYEIVVMSIEKEILNPRRGLLKDKARTVERPGIKPVVVKFDKDYFSDENNIKKLIRRLNESDKYEVSLLYLSNSLAHIEVYDYANGGGFDIFINKVNELRIIPQTQVTALALEGAIVKISDIFEGNIYETQ